MSEEPMNPEVTSDDKLWPALRYCIGPDLMHHHASDGR